MGLGKCGWNYEIGMRIGIENENWGSRLGIGNGDSDGELGLGIGFIIWDWG